MMKNLTYVPRNHGLGPLREIVDVVRTGATSNQKFACKKKYQKGEKNTTTTAVIASCAESGCQIGFFVPNGAESAKNVAQFILGYFAPPHSAGGASQKITVFYDNACSTAEQLDILDAVTADNVRLFCDRMHWRTHTTCSAMFYPDQSDSRLANLNTSISEQINKIWRPFDRTQRTQSWKRCMYERRLKAKYMNEQKYAAYQKKQKKPATFRSSQL